MRFGVDGHVFGEMGARIAEQARRAEAAGFDSIWLGDHIVSPLISASHYPYTADAAIPWDPDLEMYDSVVSASVAAASTATLRICFGVLVLPLRHPLVLANQLASLDRLSGGRVVFGCGVGWHAEEFAALGVPYETRRDRFEEWVHMLRACWTGRPGLRSGPHYRLDVEVATAPTPFGSIPILVGGGSDQAIDLAGRIGDGWYPIVTADQLTSDWLGPRIARCRVAAQSAGRDPATLRFAIYADAPIQQIAARLGELEALGVGDVVVFVDWDDPAAPARVATMLGR